MDQIQVTNPENNFENLCKFNEDFAKFQSEMPSVEFDKTNPHFKNKYASLTAIVKTASPILYRNGLGFSQIIDKDGFVETIVFHKSGHKISSFYKINFNAKPQEIGSALTYARRYGLSAALGIVSEEDDDGNNTNDSQNPIVEKLKKEIETLKAKPAEKPKEKLIFAQENCDKAMLYLASETDLSKIQTQLDRLKVGFIPDANGLHKNTIIAFETKLNQKNV